MIGELKKKSEKKNEKGQVNKGRRGSEGGLELWKGTRGGAILGQRV